MPPLRNTMRLIHRHQPDAQCLHIFPEQGGFQPLGRNVEKPEITMTGIFQRTAHFLVMHARMYEQGLDAPLTEVRHLVFHQGDERAYHQADAIQREGGTLLKMSLPPAGGQQGQYIFSLQHRPDNIFLQGTELIISPVLPEQLVQVGSRHEPVS